MQRRVLLVSLMFVTGLLAACSSGPVRRVSPPAASVQQLTVNVDGSWTVLVRLQNYSSIPMRFESTDLQMAVAGAPAGPLIAAPGISIGPASADVASIALQPSSQAKIAVANALASRRSVDYTLLGTVEAAPEEARSRTFKIDTSNTLSPVPGLDGVLR